MLALQLAQTHVLPESGRRWEGQAAPIGDEELHLIGNRSALALVRLAAAGDIVGPAIEGWLGDRRLGSLPLADPTQLPPTEDGGSAYGPDWYSATLPAAWLRRGLELRVVADGLASEWRSPAVGADTTLDWRILPFYLFGADESNSGIALDAIGTPAAALREEMALKMPVAALAVGPHAAGQAAWPTVVVSPRDDAAGTAQPAYVLSNSSQQKEGYAAMSSVLAVLNRLRQANGDEPLAVQYYAPLVMLDANGRYASPRGGLGLIGGATATGDHLFGGIFLHEQGHGLGLPHQGEAYDNGRFPYDWGSLDGSVWGYDAGRREFLPPYMPGSSSRYVRCAQQAFAGRIRPLDRSGRCIKQDPMQSGAGDQAQGYAYATFSDFSTAMMQRHLEGRTVLQADGSHAYSGGKLVADAAFAGGYRRWDAIDGTWVGVAPETQKNGLNGLDGGLPAETNVPVHAIALTMSYAGTAGATQIYPPLSFQGHLRRTIDPALAADRAAIAPGDTAYGQYCLSGGCDYTVRVTYADGSQHRALLQGGFRPARQPSGAPPASAGDPLDGNSFRTWAVNVPGRKPLARIELLATPKAWEGLPDAPVVLAERRL